MVSVTTNLPAGDRIRRQDISTWLDRVARDRSPKELDMLRDACSLAVQIHGEREEEVLRRALEVADILAGMELDTDTLVAAILHTVFTGEDVEGRQLRHRFGKGVAAMVEDMARIRGLTPYASGEELQDEERHQENLRRLLLSIADDIRVILIVLAERLRDMRNLKHQPDAVRRRGAMDTRDIYAPLANRLGIWQVKWELEDLTLRYLEPDTYKRIAGLLDGRRADRERYIEDVMGLLRGKFVAAGIKAEVFGRPKHINSIWKKMQRKDVDINQIFDLRAVRVLVDSVAECYGALGVVHGLWKHIPGEFDDYIATPKPNMYRSIHTAVIGPENKPLEVQIRTHEMHEHAELGVAAHWSYKESRKQDAEFERRVTLMRNWLEMKDEEGAEASAGDIRDEFEPARVYVLTPKGKVMELPKGATPLDFAYSIHSDVGHRCRGARVNGRITQLTQPLESGQMVEVLTSREGGPSRDWLSPHLGYLHSSRSRGKVKQWFKQQDYREHLDIGRTSLERELVRLGSTRPDLDTAAKRFNFRKGDDLLAAIGRGDVSPVQVAGLGYQPEKRGRPAHDRIPLRTPRKSGSKVSSAVEVEGVEELMTHTARCCKPVPYDPIIGFITRGRGVTVHRRDCSTVIKLPEQDQGRLVDVRWSDRSTDTSYPVDIRVIANDRKGLLRDISALVTNEELDVIAVNTHTNRRSDRASMRFTLEISDIEQLSRVLSMIAQLPEVIEVRRLV
jgi:GTP pyrophosphokinase